MFRLKQVGQDQRDQASCGGDRRPITLFSVSSVLFLCFDGETWLAPISEVAFLGSCVASLLPRQMDMNSEPTMRRTEFGGLVGKLMLEHYWPGH